MRNDKNVPMELYVVKIDETEYYTERFFQRFPEVKKVFGVYMVDFDTYTYLAETQPSFYLVHLENQPDVSRKMSDERLEELDDALRSPEDENMYLHVSDIKDVPLFKPGRFPIRGIGKYPWVSLSAEEIEEEYDGNREQAFQDAIESYFGNPI